MTIVTKTKKDKKRGSHFSQLSPDQENKVNRAMWPNVLVATFQDKNSHHFAKVSSQFNSHKRNTEKGRLHSRTQTPKLPKMGSTFLLLFPKLKNKFCLQYTLK